MLHDHILEMPNRGDVFIKDRTSPDDFGAKVLLETYVPGQFHGKADIFIGRLRNQLGHSKSAQYAACQSPPKKSTFTRDEGQIRLDGLNSRVVTGESNRIKSDIGAT